MNKKMKKMMKNKQKDKEQEQEEEERRTTKTRGRKRKKMKINKKVTNKKKSKKKNWRKRNKNKNKEEDEENLGQTTHLNLDTLHLSKFKPTPLALYSSVHCKDNVAYLIIQRKKPITQTNLQPRRCQ